MTGHEKFLVEAQVTFLKQGYIKVFCFTVILMDLWIIVLEISV